jgi:uncharacterized protein
MIRKSDLNAIIDLQKELQIERMDEIQRDILPSLPMDVHDHALIISGVRRCGKSTLIKQMMNTQIGQSFFINFDTPKLYNFEIKDFDILDSIINEGNYRKLYFDEIQSINGWELYVRQKLDEGFQVVVTGSNASLLSRELGTKLTGRHITKEIYPFSYKEFVRFKGFEIDEVSFKEYFEKGGFPEFIKRNNNEILTSLFDDILYRDVAIRHGIRDVKSLQHLLLYVIANVGSPITASRLTSLLGIKSTATILDYFGYYEQSWLLGLLPKFSWSYRAQLVNPRKAYIIDNGLVNAVSPSFTNNDGRKLENLIYWYLRQKYKSIFYFNETGCECDFVIFQSNNTVELIQVCFNINHENREREEKGLLAAMDYFKLKNGVILTMNQYDEIQMQDKHISVIPVFRYISGDKIMFDRQNS